MNKSNGDDINFNQDFYDALGELKLVYFDGLSKYPENNWKERKMAEHYQHFCDHLKAALKLGIRADIEDNKLSEDANKQEDINLELSHALCRFMMFYQQRLEM